MHGTAAPPSGEFVEKSPGFKGGVNLTHHLLQLRSLRLNFMKNILFSCLLTGLKLH